jgi:Ig-like domain-containing protein
VNRKFIVLIALVCALAALPLFAASYIVPEDRDFINRSEVIVVATAVAKCDLANAATSTCTTFRIEEVIKGPVFDQAINVVEPSGSGEGATRIIPGMPTFDVGDRALLMLRPRPHGRWIVSDMALGKFAFRTDVNGTELLVRDEDEIFGWDSRLNTYSERRRGAEAFLSFIRAEVAGEHRVAEYFVPSAPLVAEGTMVTASRFMPVPMIAPYTAASYTSAGNPRWSTTSVSYFRGTVTEPGAATGGVQAISAAMSAWSNISSTALTLTYNGSSTSDLGLCDPSFGCPNGKADGKNTIQFERDLSWAGAPAFTCSGSGYSGVLGIGGMWVGGASHTGPNGETFVTGVDGDVEMNQGIANCTLLFGNGDFNTAVAHEVGHSIGFRHSDQGKSQGAGCDSNTMECSSSAIMKAFITQGISASPRTYDQHAMQAVYPGVTQCTGATVSVQPVGSTITQGSSASLSVTAAGTAPFTYAWYVGNPPSTTTPAGTTATIQVSPATTTNYWVRVTNSCGTADSNAATITVNPVVCNGAQVTTQPQSTAISFGAGAQLSVVASGTAPLTYQWYTGVKGNTFNPIQNGTSATLAVTPISTTQYWVRVTNSCGTADSNNATVTVNCASPVINVQPPNRTINSGSSAFLNVVASGGPNLTYQWYTGIQGDTSNPIPTGTTSSITVSPTTNTSYWVRVSVTGGCSPTDSQTATVIVNVNSPCPVVTITTPTVVQNGTSYTLTTSASTALGGGTVTITWTQQTTAGQVPVGTGSSITVSPTATTLYLATATNTCGSTNSAPVTVTIGGCAAPAVTQPGDQTIGLGSATTITVSASGGTLHYQWFQGAAGDTSHSVGTDSATLSPGPLLATTPFWVKVTNDCSTTATSSSTITITVAPARRRGARH